MTERSKTMKNRIVISDIDGTVANIEHRRHFVASKPKNWAAFNAAMVNDAAHLDIFEMLGTFRNAGATIVFASGRGEEYRDVTEKFLDQHFNRKNYAKLYMRPAKDYRSDVEIKLEILAQIRQEYGEPFMAVDDRDAVVKMWREQGIRTLQVDYGNF